MCIRDRFPIRYGPKGFSLTDVVVCSFFRRDSASLDVFVFSGTPASINLPHLLPPPPSFLWPGCIFSIHFPRVRAEEIRALLRATTLRAVNEAMFFAQPVVVACLVFTTYYLLGNVLTPPKVSTHVSTNSFSSFPSFTVIMTDC